MSIVDMQRQPGAGMSPRKVGALAVVLVLVGAGVAAVAGAAGAMGSRGAVAVWLAVGLLALLAAVLLLGRSGRLARRPASDSDAAIPEHGALETAVRPADPASSPRVAAGLQSAGHGGPATGGEGSPRTAVDRRGEHSG